jgi:hypothetical protein
MVNTLLLIKTMGVIQISRISGINENPAANTLKHSAHKPLAAPLIVFSQEILKYSVPDLFHNEFPHSQYGEAP